MPRNSAPRLLLRELMPAPPVLIQSREIEELADNFRMSNYRGSLEQFFGKRFDDDPNLFHSSFGGVNRIVKEWLLGECSQSAAEITDSIVSLTFSLATAVGSG